MKRGNLPDQIRWQAQTTELSHAVLCRFSLLLSCSTGLRTDKTIIIKATTVVSFKHEWAKQCACKRCKACRLRNYMTDGSCLLPEEQDWHECCRSSLVLLWTGTAWRLLWKACFQCLPRCLLTVTNKHVFKVNSVKGPRHHHECS